MLYGELSATPLPPTLVAGWQATGRRKHAVRTVTNPSTTQHPSCTRWEWARRCEACTTVTTDNDCARDRIPWTWWMRWIWVGWIWICWVRDVRFVPGKCSAALPHPSAAVPRSSATMLSSPAWRRVTLHEQSAPKLLLQPIRTISPQSAAQAYTNNQTPICRRVRPRGRAVVLIGS